MLERLQLLLKMYKTLVNTSFSKGVEFIGRVSSLADKQQIFACPLGGSFVSDDGETPLRSNIQQLLLFDRNDVAD